MHLYFTIYVPTYEQYLDFYLSLLLGLLLKNNLPTYLILI